jgi:hypothetical protein
MRHRSLRKVCALEAKWLRLGELENEGPARAGACRADAGDDVQRVAAA